MIVAVLEEKQLSLHLPLTKTTIKLTYKVRSDCFGVNLKLHIFTTSVISFYQSLSKQNTQ